MLYFFLGILLGIIISIAPVWSPSGAFEIYPEWQGNIESINNIEPSPNASLPGTGISLIARSLSDIFYLSSNGKFIKKINFNNHLAALSGSGEYYVQYDKIGSHIEMFNAKGERFWRLKSMEYPYISYNAKIILLMNGDHSNIRIIDSSGKEAGAKTISGPLCTVISTDGDSDYSGIGFLNGSYYILDDKGSIIYQGIAPGNSIIKGINISTTGKFAAVLYGTGKSDSLILINIKRGKTYIIPLKYISLTKSNLLVTDNGDIAAFDFDKIIITEKDDIESAIKIPAKKSGLSSISASGNLLTASYTDIEGRTNMFIFLKDGTVLFHKIFQGENFVESRIIGKAIYVRGSSGLYCYSFDFPKE